MRFLTRQKAALRRFALLFIGSCLCLMFLPTQARAATGIIADDAHVLDATTIQQYTDPFTYTVDIFTTNAFQGSNDDFDASLKGLTNDSATPTSIPCDPKNQVGCQLFSINTIPVMTGTVDSSGPTPGATSTVNSSRSTPAATSTVYSNNPTPAATSSADDSEPTSLVTRNGYASQSVEIGIDVSSRHLAIYSGQSVTIPQDNYDNAIQAFADTMHQTHDNYTQATIAALNALQSANDRFWQAARPWFLGALLLGGLILLSIVLQSKGGQGPSDDDDNDGDGYNRRRNYYHNTYTSWNSGGGGWNSGGGGTSSGGGGGGGGASGNF